MTTILFARDADNIDTPFPGVGIHRKVVIVLCSTIPAAILLIILVGTVHCIKRHRRKAAAKKDEEERTWPHQPLPPPRLSHETQRSRLSHDEISPYNDVAPGPFREPFRRSRSAPGQPSRVYQDPKQFPRGTVARRLAQNGRFPVRPQHQAEGLRIGPEQMRDLHL